MKYQLTIVWENSMKGLSDSKEVIEDHTDLLKKVEKAIAWEKTKTVTIVIVS